MTTPAETALALLRESRDGARIWHDNGAAIARLTCERRVVGDTITNSIEEGEDNGSHLE